MNTLRAIIYCRKSTDRDDKQQNSLESQMNACMRTLENGSFYLVETFIESASAKKSGNRPYFEKMLSLCRKKKVDYIIVDEASRLSRNNTDSAKILGLLEEGHIKGIATSSQKYLGEQASELFMLLLSFGMAKFDNDTRARNVKARMVTCAEKGRCLGKAPFGYKNITLLHDGQIAGKGVVPFPLHAKIVQEIFALRSERKMTIQDIANFCKGKYEKLIENHKFSVQGIEKMLQNPFYIGMIRYAGKTYVGQHEAIISTSVFEKVQSMERGYYTHRKDSTPLQYLYKGLIKDNLGIPLTAEVKKGKYIYYKNQNLRSPCRVNLSEKSIIEFLAEEFKEIYFPSHFYKLILKIAKEEIEKMNQGKKVEEGELDKELVNLREKEKRLMNGYLEGIIDAVRFRKTNDELQEKIVILEAKKQELKKYKFESFEQKLKEMFELHENLSERYKQASFEEKQLFHEKLKLELFVNNKKELVLHENKLFSSLRTIGFNGGSATENRTPVCGMKTRCPNH